MSTYIPCRSKWPPAAGQFPAAERRAWARQPGSCHSHPRGRWEWLWDWGPNDQQVEQLWHAGQHMTAHEARIIWKVWWGLRIEDLRTFWRYPDMIYGDIPWFCSSGGATWAVWTLSLGDGRRLVPTTQQLGAIFAWKWRAYPPQFMAHRGENEVLNHDHSLKNWRCPLEVAKKYSIPHAYKTCVYIYIIHSSRIILVSYLPPQKKNHPASQEIAGLGRPTLGPTTALGQPQVAPMGFWMVLRGMGPQVCGLINIVWTISISILLVHLWIL